MFSAARGAKLPGKRDLLYLWCFSSSPFGFLAAASQSFALLFSPSQPFLVLYKPLLKSVNAHCKLIHKMLNASALLSSRDHFNEDKALFYLMR